MRHEHGCISGCVFIFHNWWILCQHGILLIFRFCGTTWFCGRCLKGSCIWSARGRRNDGRPYLCEERLFICGGQKVLSFLTGVWLTAALLICRSESLQKRNMWDEWIKHTLHYNGKRPYGVFLFLWQDLGSVSCSSHCGFRLTGILPWVRRSSGRVQTLLVQYWLLFQTKHRCSSRDRTLISY